MALSKTSRDCRYEFLSALHKGSNIGVQTGDILKLDGVRSILDRKRIESIELSEALSCKHPRDNPETLALVAGMQHCFDVCPKLRRMTLEGTPRCNIVDFSTEDTPKEALRDIVPTPMVSEWPLLVRSLVEDPWPLILGMLVCRAVESCPRGKDIDVNAEMPLILHIEINRLGQTTYHSPIIIGILKIDAASKQMVLVYESEEHKVCDLVTDDDEVLLGMYDRTSIIVT